MKLDKPYIAFFDFDGTITKDDSLIKFIHFAVGDIIFIGKMMILSPMLIAYKLKLIPNDKAKEIMLSFFFKGMTFKHFESIARDYSFHHITTILRPQAMEKIKWHQQEGHKVVIVSASIECWLRPWCEEHNLELLGTKLAYKDGIFIGKFLSKNCYGIEKEKRIKEIYTLEDYEYIYAYGDSAGDKELLALANESFYKPFRN